MYTLFYTVAVRANFVWLVREPHSWRLGKWTKSGKLRLFSKKTDLFLDSEDRDKICRVLAKSAGDDRERIVGAVEVLFVRGLRGVVSIRAGGHDQADEPQDEPFPRDSPHGDLHNWTEFATWSQTKGVRFNKEAHPVFRKDYEALAAAAAEVAGGSGVFKAETGADDTSIFSGQHLTEL